MQDPETEEILKGVEITVAMEQLVFAQQTKRGNQTVDGFADRVAAPAQVSIVLCGRYRQGAAAVLKNMEFQEGPLNPGKLGCISDALQDLTQDKICKPKPLPVQFAVQPNGFRIFVAP
jgi:hypothetical protein